MNSLILSQPLFGSECAASGKSCNKSLQNDTTTLKPFEVGCTHLGVKGRHIGEKRMKYYYTAGEARQFLDMDVGAFYYLIETGKIKRIIPPGKKRGFYSKHQIQRLADQNLNHGTSEDDGAPIFMKATWEDLDEEFELATLLLNGNAPYGIPTYHAWLSKNPDTNFILRDQGRLVAFLLVLPVQPGTIKRWINGEIREWEINSEDILPYAPHHSLECIIMSMATTSDVDISKRRAYGLRITRGYLHFLYMLAAQGITITRFYSMGATTEGSSILKQAGFVERGQIGKRFVFDFNPTTSASLMAQAYRASLNNRRDNTSAATRMRI